MPSAAVTKRTMDAAVPTRWRSAARGSSSGILLQHQSHPSLGTHGFLSGRQRPLAAHGNGQHHAGKEHEFLHRQQDQHVFGRRFGVAGHHGAHPRRR